eukprot:363990-Chlamydomonas_euryale.AAC.7
MVPLQLIAHTASNCKPSVHGSSRSVLQPADLGATGLQSSCDACLVSAQSCVVHHAPPSAASRGASRAWCSADGCLLSRRALTYCGGRTCGQQLGSPPFNARAKEKGEGGLQLRAVGPCSALPAAQRSLAGAPGPAGFSTPWNKGTQSMFAMFAVAAGTPSAHAAHSIKRADQQADRPHRLHEVGQRHTKVVPQRNVLHARANRATGESGKEM